MSTQEMSLMVADALSRLLKENWDELQIDKNKINTDKLWAQLDESGYLDLLIPESDGGAGLELSDSYEILRLCGYYAVSLPLATTILARLWLGKAGADVVSGAITLAAVYADNKGFLSSNYIPFVNNADYVLADLGANKAALIKVSDLVNKSATEANVQVFNTTADSNISNLIATCFSILLAGAADRALEITLEYAGQRTQFGRNIGRFQAIQNQISSMAERIYAMRMAAQMVCNNNAYAQIAMTKMVCSEAASQVIATSHAVHGAIGITQEYHLQRFTRLMHEWRRIGGSESFWANQLGKHILSGAYETNLDFILSELA